MAQFELNIYGQDDEIINHFETNFVRWGIFLEALELEKKKGELSAVEMIEAVSGFMKKIFVGLTDEDLSNAVVDDILNTFNQVIRKANKIGGNSKNGAGAE